jgi:hypothetical protein
METDLPLSLPPRLSSLCGDLRPFPCRKRRRPGYATLPPQGNRCRIFNGWGFGFGGFSDGLQEHPMGKFVRVARAGSFRHGPIIPSVLRESTARFFKLTHYPIFSLYLFCFQQNHPKSAENP